jgi:hypothetical protein
MRKILSALALVSALSLWATSAQAQNLLSNGSLDQTVDVEIVPGFFLPKPAVWQNIGTRTITGPYEDEMSSEPWAGPAPTPVTTGGSDGGDWAVFFKPFSGNLATDGPATGHLQQAVPGTAGTNYKLTGWAGAEANALMADAVFAIDFLNSGGGVIGSSSLSLLPTLFVPNGQPFNYKQYTVTGVAPAGTTQVQARASMIDALGNPAGGGQAFVIDDFVLSRVPEPATLGMLGFGLMGLQLIRRRK